MKTLLKTLNLLILTILAMVLSPKAFAADGDILILQRSGTQGAVVQSTAAAGASKLLVTGTDKIVTTSATLPAGTAISTGTGTPTQGTLVVTGSSLKIYLTGSTGLTVSGTTVAPF